MFPFHIAERERKTFADREEGEIYRMIDPLSHRAKRETDNGSLPLTIKGNSFLNMDHPVDEGKVELNFARGRQTIHRSISEDFQFHLSGV